MTPLPARPSVRAVPCGCRDLLETPSGKKALADFCASAEFLEPGVLSLGTRPVGRGEFAQVAEQDGRPNRWRWQRLLNGGQFGVEIADEHAFDRHGSGALIEQWRAWRGPAESGCPSSTLLIQSRSPSASRPASMMCFCPLARK